MAAMATAFCFPGFVAQSQPEPHAHRRWNRRRQHASSAPGHPPPASQGGAGAERQHVGPWRDARQRVLYQPLGFRRQPSRAWSPAPSRKRRHGGVPPPPKVSSKTRQQRRPSNAQGKGFSWCYSIIGYAGQMGAIRRGRCRRRRWRAAPRCGTGTRPQSPPPIRAAGAAVLSANQVTLSGPIRPQHVVGVGAQAGAVIDAFLVTWGNRSYQGQVLGAHRRSGSGKLPRSGSSAVEHAQNASAGPRPPWPPRAWNNPAPTPKRNAPASNMDRAEAAHIAPAVALQPGARRRASSSTRHRANTTARGPSPR